MRAFSGLHIQTALAAEQEILDALEKHYGEAERHAFAGEGEDVGLVTVVVLVLHRAGGEAGRDGERHLSSRQRGKSQNLEVQQQCE